MVREQKIEDPQRKKLSFHFPSNGVEMLEKGMATHSSILAWRISWAEEPDRLHSKGLQKELDMAQQLTNKQQILYCIFFPKPDLRCCI